MLGVTQLSGFGAAFLERTLTYIGENGHGTPSNPHTFSSEPVGAADGTRLVIVGVTYTVGATCSLSSANIGGSAATIVTDSGCTSAANRGAAIIQKELAAGETADIQLTFSTGVNDLCIVVWTLTNATSNVAHASDSTTVNAGASISRDINIPADGVAVGVASAASTITSYTWAGLTERFDTAVYGSHDTTAGDEAEMAAETPRTITVTPTSASDMGLAVASWS